MSPASVTGASVHPAASCLAWSELRIYARDEPGQNHGLLLGTLGWKP